MHIVDLRPEERLTVAADFNPAEWGGREGVLTKVMKLADDLAGTGVTFKVNTILRATGYRLLDEIANRSMVPWADLKLSDTKDTDTSDGGFLGEVKAPRLLVTVKCDSGPATLRHLVAKFPTHIELIGITALSDMSDDDCMAVFGCSAAQAVYRFALMAADCRLDGLVCSGKDVGGLSDVDFPGGFTLNTLNIRPAGLPVKDDGQNKKRAATITEALQLGTSRVVIGRPITQHPNPYDAVMICLDEVRAFCSGLPG